jgi:short-subunit dehydrogenase
VLVARREDVLRQLEARLRIENSELEIRTLAFDLSKESDRHELIDSVAGTEWSPSLLVNNAGMGDYGAIRTASWAKLRQIIELSITALTHLTHGFLPGMMAARRGAILNVSSLASLLPVPDFGVYAASKAYVTSFSEALRLELREHGIPVLAVCPGPVHTEFGETAGRDGAPAETPTREWFHVPKETVVRESLRALAGGRPRVYPGWKVAMLAAGISLLPLAALRYVMSYRPRSVPGDEA